MEKVKFPIVRNISPLSISNDIIGMTSEETRENLEIIFKDFEKITGFVPTIVGDKSPINILFKKNRIMKNFREELFKYLYEFDYVTKDRDGEIHLWKGRPKWSESGDYWVSDGSFMCIDDGFEFSEFEDVEWRDCIISLNSDNDKIDELKLSNDELNIELLEVKEKIKSVNMISGDVDLTHYLSKLNADRFRLERFINDNLDKIKELKN